MNSLLKDAQRILDDCRENHLHPANNTLHPLHQEIMMAINELERIVFEMTDKPKINMARKRRK